MTYRKIKQSHHWLVARAQGKSTVAKQGTVEAGKSQDPGCIKRTLTPTPLMKGGTASHGFMQGHKARCDQIFQFVQEEPETVIFIQKFPIFQIWVRKLLKSKHYHSLVSGLRFTDLLKKRNNNEQGVEQRAGNQ